MWPLVRCLLKHEAISSLLKLIAMYTCGWASGGKTRMARCLAPPSSISIQALRSSCPSLSLNQNASSDFTPHFLRGQGDTQEPRPQKLAHRRRLARWATGRSVCPLEQQRGQLSRHGLPEAEPRPQTSYQRREESVQGAAQTFSLLGLSCHIPCSKPWACETGRPSSLRRGRRQKARKGRRGQTSSGPHTVTPFRPW